MKRLAVTLLLLVGACARSAPPMVTSGDAQRGNVELAELQQGRQLLIGKCASCHKAPMPSEHTAADWPQKLDEMATRAHLDFSQQKLIEKYLVTMSTPEQTPTR